MTLPVYPKPTPRQLEVLGRIAAIQERSGLPPTVRELCMELGLKSTNAGAELIQALERCGLVERRRMTARGLLLTDAGRQLVDLPPAPEAA